MRSLRKIGMSRLMMPLTVKELIDKFDEELSDPSISDRRRRFIEGRREIHLELWEVFMRLANGNSDL
jgi:hypothetical protein